MCVFVCVCVCVCGYLKNSLSIEFVPVFSETE